MIRSVIESRCTVYASRALLCTRISSLSKDCNQYMLTSTCSLLTAMPLSHGHGGKLKFADVSITVTLASHHCNISRYCSTSHYCSTLSATVVTFNVSHYCNTSHHCSTSCHCNASHHCSTLSATVVTYNISHYRNTSHHCSTSCHCTTVVTTVTLVTT